MATATSQKKPCSKCDKGGGIFTCDGCQQSFCRKHSEEHRQELATEMDSIGQEHDIIQRDINRENAAHSLLSRIDVWERESINKIQQVANQARVELNQLIGKTKQELQTTMTRLTHNLQSSRESEDYTEIDLKKWIDQLNELRQDLEQSMNMYVLDNDDQGLVIRLIKVRKSQQLRSSTSESCHTNQNSISVNHERFHNRDQEIILTESDLVATYLGPDLKRTAFVYGAIAYSTDTHRIQFRIEKKTNRSFFFGIITFYHINPSFVQSSSNVNGWWLENYAVSNGISGQKLPITSILEGDEVALAIDCDQRRISLGPFAK